MFCIDPEDTMITALQGGESRLQLEVAYAILSKWLCIAQQTVTKYKAEYQRIEVPLSPISMVPDLYEDFSNLDSMNNQMRYMLKSIPHHQNQLSAESLNALSTGQAWDVAYPTTPISDQGPSQLLSHSKDQVRAVPLQPKHERSKGKDTWPTHSQWEDSDMFPAQGRNEAEG